MKLTYSRRYRRSPSRSIESIAGKKDVQQEQVFFAAPSEKSFFRPNQAVQRKCDHCAAEDKKVQRMGLDKDEDKKVQKMESSKEEDHVHKKEDESGVGHLDRAAEHKEEDKVQKMPEKKEDDKIQREPEKKEEQKLQKMEEKKEDVPVHRAADHKEEEKAVAKKESGPSGAASPQTHTYIQSLHGKGSALPKEAQLFFENRMGQDFSAVRIHTGNEAEQSAKDINAKAYTTGYNIVFNKGQYNPASTDGKKLLAHELTHVIQQKGSDPGWLGRVAELTEKKREEEKPVSISGVATKTKNKTSHGCAGVNVQGETTANYGSSFKAAAKTRSSTECTDCTAPDCITVKGFVFSKFKADPKITLPEVPDGLSKCEANAVRRFINGTLRRHEQQHVAAFNTYTGVVKTPLEYTGCRAGLDLLAQSIHDGVDAQRTADANAKSDALDPFNVPIPCNCKESTASVE